MSSTVPGRLLVTAAGLFGALGVAAAARASHAGDDNLGIAANFLLLHAPVLIGLSLMAASRLAVAAGAVMTVGVALFAGDLVMRAFTGNALFPMAAPTGGGAMIAGWVLVMVSGIWGRRS
ncbi:MAG: DUF423 domain-containing protein [Devosia sp.]|uniref:DUF423 domain-containing protein n=1 Tax=Devosia sp. TaxID=1871048 RepID=UPI001ACF4073|nr:DUF423 domain-containing protein [Devosia sp.]MBN9310062.1 DUF423 domain-containing protein [Devosia sp.]MBN9317587.1 DUF423 domain-containing protein [Devosia sp.]